ncbi:hypothetical protein [Kitasatospora terrestris]|uniref:Uncharacterized protein n=1 Tax=Kitasatospora terrestris TaxID=258051 RepID=A0ABP9DDF1_9ACTN
MISNVKHDDKAATGSFATNGAPLTDTTAHLSISATGTGADVRVQLGAGGTAPTGKPAADLFTTPTPSGPSTAPASPPPSRSDEHSDDHAAIGSTSASLAPATTATCDGDEGDAASTDTGRRCPGGHRRPTGLSVAAAFSTNGVPQVIRERWPGRSPCGGW